MSKLIEKVTKIGQVKIEGVGITVEKIERSTEDMSWSCPRITLANDTDVCLVNSIEFPAMTSMEDLQPLVDLLAKAAKS